VFSLHFYYNFSEHTRLRWVKLKKKNKLLLRVITDTLFTTFLGFLDYTTLHCISDTSNSTSTYTFFFNKFFSNTLALLLRSDINAYPTTLYDLSGTYLEKRYLYTLGFSNNFTSRRWLFLTELKTLSIISLSSIYECSIWLEREISELDSLKINLLKDTRRLLQDYTLIASKYHNPNLYVTKSYSNIIQDLL
jgi:hypothetical protein